MENMDEDTDPAPMPKLSALERNAYEAVVGGDGDDCKSSSDIARDVGAPSRSSARRWARSSTSACCPPGGDRDAAPDPPLTAALESPPAPRVTRATAKEAAAEAAQLADEASATRRPAATGAMDEDDPPAAPDAMDEEAPAAPQDDAALESEDDDEEAAVAPDGRKKPSAPDGGWAKHRRDLGNELAASRPAVPGGYDAAPSFGLPPGGDDATQWTPTPLLRVVRVVRSATVEAAAVAAAAAAFIPLVRTKARRYKVDVPEELTQEKGDARRGKGGALWQVWMTCVAAAALAQPRLGSGGICLPDWFAGTVRLKPVDVLGLICADGSFYVTVSGVFGMASRLMIEAVLSVHSIQLLVALKNAIGTGSVHILACRHLGYYVKVVYKASDSTMLRFLATHWHLGGVKARQLQLANLALREAKLCLGRGYGIAWHEGTQLQYDARNVLFAVLKRLKSADAVKSTSANVAWYGGLFAAMTADQFVAMVTFFFEGDGGSYISDGKFCIGFFQSDQGFLVALRDALVSRRLVAAAGDFHVTETPAKVVGPTVHKRTRKAYRCEVYSAPACVALARALYGVYEDRGAAHFPKARKLKLMIDHGKPSAAAVAAYKLIKD
ncbi:beta-1,6-glucosyl hydrolase [Aureococcus anophagefferens]|uniref:Beta-1,6-glucosyl hydrolase n=1 Tax=Aureococcus anophagefferens TaxID=44056 RepID=A0ABR1FSQ0_AURAN